MKKIYIILTNTGTVLSRIIRTYTKDEFAHVSISLDSELKEMYSFGRKNPYNPFIGGFMHEGIDVGTFKRFYKTKAKIYELEVTDEQYNKMERLIHSFWIHKSVLRFNIMGMFLVGFNRKRKKKAGFYCAEFVQYALEHCDIDLGLPELVRPENFKTIGEKNSIYLGLLREYKTA